MATYTNFSILPADISARLHNTVFSLATSPTSTTIQSIIDENASLVCGEALASGIDATSISAGTQEYTNLKAAVIYKTVGDYLVLEQRGKLEAGTYYYEQYKTMIQTIRNRPQAIEITGIGPNLTKLVSTITPSLDVFPSTILGKIVRGGL
jgi:hypothetical protein